MNLFQTAFTSKRKTGSRRAGGFALVEVLVSVTIFAVGIMAVLTAVLSVLELQKDATLRFRAGLVLQEKLAESIHQSYDGQPIRGLSPDGVFQWMVTGSRWVDAPKAPPKTSLNTSSSKPSGTGSTRGKARLSRGQKQKQDSDADSLEDQIILVVVDVSWQTSKGSRSIQATQLVHAAPQARGMP